MKLYNFLAKHGQMVGFGLGMLVVLLFALQWMAGYSELAAMPDAEKPTTNIFDIGLIGSFVLFIVAFVAVIIFGLLQIFGDLKGSMKSMLGVGVLVLIFIVAYATSSSEATGVVKATVDKLGTTPGVLKLIGAGLTTMIVFMILTAVVLVISEVRNFVK